MTVEDQIKKQRLKILKELSFIEDVRKTLQEFSVKIPYKNFCWYWIRNAIESLEHYADQRKLNAHLLNISLAMDLVLKDVCKCSDNNEWYYPWNEKINKPMKATYCNRLVDLGLVKQKRIFSAYKITEKGKRYLKEIGMK